MYAHRGFTPFIDFLPVLAISSTEQHVVLSAGVLRLIQELAILFSITPCTLMIWHHLHTSPFGTATVLRP